LGKIEVLEFVRKMKPHDHALMFYAEPEDKHLVFSIYLKAALERKGAAAYFFSQESAMQTATALKQFGLNLDKYMKSGALQLIDQSRRSLMDSTVNQEDCLNQIKNLYNQLASKGFREVRIAEEMAFFLNNNMINCLIEYERSLKSLNLPVTIICGYEFESFCRQGDGDLYLNLIKSHDTIIFAGPKEWVVNTY
jgi:KaiC/GvpD/RAD55 family RecA-like ATPase